MQQMAYSQQRLPYSHQPQVLTRLPPPAGLTMRSDARVGESAAYGSFGDRRGTTDPEGGVDKVDEKGGMFLTKGMFIFFGFSLLAVLCALPIWDAVESLRNFNYFYWAGRDIPVLVISGSGVIVILFLFMTEAFFGRWRGQDHAVQNIVMMASLFVTILGLLFVMTSLPMSSKAIETHNDIMYQCSNSFATRDLRSYYLTLLELRQTPSCAEAYSIEECDGYQERPPMSDYLKYMETQFRCSGFCHGSPTTLLAESGANASAVPSTLDSVRLGSLDYLVSSFTPTGMFSKSDPGKGSSSSTSHPPIGLFQVNSNASSYPPTLFSSAGFKVSCDGAAARNMLTFARDSAYQTWYTGIVLVAISIGLGMWDWNSLVAK